MQSCTEKTDVDILMPAYQDRIMAQLAALSFFKFETNLKIKIIFIDPSGKTEPFDVGSYQNRISFLSIPDKEFQFTDKCGKMSHSNAYALECGAKFCDAPYVFVCHNDVVAYRKNWLFYLVEKMKNYKLAAFLRDNIRIRAAHVSGFLYDRIFFSDKNVSFWPKSKPVMDVGDEYSHYLQKNKMDYFVCRCSHNDPDLLKQIVIKHPELKSVSGDKCIDEHGNVMYIHVGRGTVKMMGHYKKKNKTNYKEWIRFVKGHLNVDSV